MKNNARLYQKKREAGFTLLEILIALFIFTLLSLMLSGALRSVINTEVSTEKSAERLRDLQMTLLILSRDIEQTMNRPVVNAVGTEDPALIGDPRGFTFTHTGFANPNTDVRQSALQRTRYEWDGSALYRLTWPLPDQAPQSLPRTRRLLIKASHLDFQYLDQAGVFHDNWPLSGQTKEPLPRAIKVALTISYWGSMSQLYVISAKANQAPAQNGLKP